MDSDVGRRTVLGSLVGAGALAATAASAANSSQPAPSPPTELPRAWTRARRFAIWPGEAPGAADFRPQPLPERWSPSFLRNTRSPSLHLFGPHTSNGGALLVIPGGGYEFVSIANEGVDVAARMCPLGYTVFVLDYRLPGEGWRNAPDVPLQDAQRAMRFIRSGARGFGVDPARISVIGFSAGGHLAASLATGFAERVHEPSDGADRLDARPDAAALIYPVVTMTQPYTHAGSRRFLLGSSPSDQLVAARSPEQHVTAALPPLFLAHACDDPAVPVENSLMLLAAARAARRPVEAHLFQEGGHAFGVGRPGTPSAEWMPLLHLWLQRTLSR